MNQDNECPIGEDCEQCPYQAICLISESVQETQERISRQLQLQLQLQLDFS